MHILRYLMPPPNKWLRKELHIKISRQLGIDTHHRYHNSLGGLTHTCTNESWKKSKCVCQGIRAGDTARVTVHIPLQSGSPCPEVCIICHHHHHHPQVPACAYACIPGGISTKWLKLVGRGTGNLHNRSGNKMVHSKSSICCDFYMLIYKITGLLPCPLNYKFLEGRNHVLLISVSPAPNVAPGM